MVCRPCQPKQGTKVQENPLESSPSEGAAGATAVDVCERRRTLTRRFAPGSPVPGEARNGGYRGRLIRNVVGKSVLSTTSMAPP